MIRKTIFWMHLISGVLAGLVIFMMSLTGVILTYERQIMHWLERGDYVITDLYNVPPLSVDALLDFGNYHDPDFEPSSIVINNHPGAPISLSAGRRGRMDLNPYTGEIMQPGSESLNMFFSAVTGWHRWFNLSGESRASARAITGASNLLFLFLILSGIYLWLPHIYRWVMFKIRLLFVMKPPNSQARDFNWHHVFGIWSAIPLVVVVATATVFNYTWANNLVYQVYGEPPPQRGSGSSPPADMALNIEADMDYLSLDQLMQKARLVTEQELGYWHTIGLVIPELATDKVSVSVDTSIGGQPQNQYTLTLDRHSGQMLAISDFSDRSAGARTRSIFRFLHTGEVLGFWGQTIAGLVSFTSLFLVWTGFALAYRRLIKPLFRKS